MVSELETFLTAIVASTDANYRPMVAGIADALRTRGTLTDRQWEVLRFNAGKKGIAWPESFPKASRAEAPTAEWVWPDEPSSTAPSASAAALATLHADLYDDVAKALQRAASRMREII